MRSILPFLTFVLGVLICPVWFLFLLFDLRESWWHLTLDRWKHILRAPILRNKFQNWKLIIENNNKPDYTNKVKLETWYSEKYFSSKHVLRLSRKCTGRAVDFLIIRGLCCLSASATADGSRRAAAAAAGRLAAATFVCWGCSCESIFQYSISNKKYKTRWMRNYFWFSSMMQIEFVIWILNH